MENSCSTPQTDLNPQFLEVFKKFEIFDEILSGGQNSAYQNKTPHILKI